MDPVKALKVSPSAFWRALLLFFLVAGFLTAADELSLHLRLDGWQRLVDDVLGGVIAGSIFYMHESRRLRRLRKQLQVIDLMNHHIRNALQPLLFVEYKERATMKLIEECADRIDWALREVLTGNSQERFASGSKPGKDPPRTFFYGWFDAWRKRTDKIPDLEKVPSSMIVKRPSH